MIGSTVSTFVNTKYKCYKCDKNLNSNFYKTDSFK